MQPTNEVRRQNEKAEAERQSQLKSSRRAFIASITTSVISAASSVGVAFFTYHYTEKARTEISAQTLEIDRARASMTAQSVEIEKVRLELQKASQQTFEANSKLEQSRLEMQQAFGTAAQRTDEERLRMQKFAAASADRESAERIRLAELSNQRDEAKLVPDVAKLSSDLRPSMTFDCSLSMVGTDVIKVFCRYLSTSAYRVSVTPMSFEAIDEITRKPIPGFSQSVDGLERNTVLANTNGSSSEVYIRLSDVGIERMRQHPLTKIQATYKAVTEQQSVNLVRRLAKGYMTEEDVTQAATQNYGHLFNW